MKNHLSVTGSLVWIPVLGTGYLGATHAACLAACGHTVVGVDADPERVAVLRRGRAPFHEPGLDELLRNDVASGRLCFTNDLGQRVDRRGIIDARLLLEPHEWRASAWEVHALSRGAAEVA